MKWGIFYLLLLTFTILNAQDSKGTIKALYEEAGHMKLAFIVSDITHSFQFNQVRSEIVDPGVYKVLDSKYDRTKQKAEFYIASTSPVGINDIESLIISLGFHEVNYNGNIIKTLMLSDVYEPFFPVEFIYISRN